MFDAQKKLQDVKRRDFGAIGAFVCAIGVLVIIGFYVAVRLSGTRAYQEKWKDYDDCGWA